MSRLAGIGNLLQAAVFGLLASYLHPRWGPSALLAGMAALLHLAGGLGLFLRRPRMAFWASLSTLTLVAVLMGLFAHATLHLVDRFGEDAAATGREALAGSLLALPWLVAFPLWQILAGRPHRRAASLGGAGILLGFLLPPLVGALWSRPVQAWPAQPALGEAAGLAFRAWTAGAPLRGAIGDGPATVLLTPWEGGRPGEAVRGDGPTLEAALSQAVSALPPPGASRPALVLDLARERYRDNVMPPGEGGGLSPQGGLSPSAGWHPDTGKRISYAWPWPRLRVPFLRLGDLEPTRFDSVLVDEDGPRMLLAGWTAPDALDPDAALQAALEGARMISRNQDPDTGQFAYEVKGPSGARGRGYNLPRHAGTTWFLARVHARTGDEEIGAAALRGIRYMEKRSHPLPGNNGASYVADGRRDDGVAWVGTTALAVLAATSLEHPVAERWGAFVAASVDARGQVRGEVQRQTGQFPPQKQNPYGQGQAQLALAARVRAGQEALRPALERAARFTDGDYAPLGADRLVVLDEHWACLAALATREATGQPAGWSLCRAYLSDLSHRTPSVEGGFWPSAGPAGGAAEAVVAGALLDPEGPWREQALAYGRLFLASAYQPGDAPFLHRPDALLGGFRDRPPELDVRMDAVQHIGCALLGIEALLSGSTRPGALP